MTTSGRTGAEQLRQFLRDYSALGDADLQAELLIETADRFSPVPPEIASRPFGCENRVPACESEAYVWMQQDAEKRLRFYFAVENPQGISAKALAVILDEHLSGSPPEEVLQVSPDIVYQIFGRSLSMGKGQGLMGMINMVRGLAAQARSS